MNICALPWPNRLLSPNSRVHHMLKARSARAHRIAARAIADQDGRKRLRNPSLAILPIVRDRRRRDIDNVLAGLKSTLDGLGDAGWWTDDSEIATISIRRPVLIRSWSRDPVIVAAVESCNESFMLARIREFVEECTDSPEQSWCKLISHRSLSHG